MSIKRKTIATILVLIPAISVVAFCGYLEWRKSVAAGAVMADDISKIDTLLSNDLRFIGQSMLVQAFRNKKKVAFVHLLEKGVDSAGIRVDTFNLIHAASIDDDLFWLEQLLKFGGNPNETAGRYNVEPLALAISKNKLLNARLLVAAGASINSVENLGHKTLLNFAYCQGFGEIAYFLLTNGADYNPVGTRRVSFIEYVREAEFTPIKSDPVDMRDYAFILKIRQWFVDNNLDIDAATWVEMPGGQGVWKIPPIE